MGFPFIKPFDDWLIKKLKKREENTLKLSMINPFVILTSPAIVTNDIELQNGKMTGQKIKDIIEGKSAKPTYYGCIISNETNPKKIYNTEETIVGYDFGGNSIKVIGEKNRRVPKPSIESLEINTDGANNTLKTASLKIKVFSLKQLEMFELFFLRPSMHLLVEFGSNESFVFDKENVLDDAIISKKTWTNFLTEYQKNFSTKVENRKNYLDKIEKAKGDYDFVAGTVTNFTFTIAEDLSYEVDLEISSANTMLMWLPVTPSKDTSNTKQQSIKFDKFEQWYKKLEADLDVTLSAELKNESNWKNEFFNWDMIAEKQDETKASISAYLTVRYILELINDIFPIKTGTSNLHTDVFFEDSEGKKPLIPCNTLDNIISHTSDIILPGKLPILGVTEKKDKIVIKKQDNKIQTNDFKINGYRFNLESTGGFYDYEKKIIESTKSKQYGNLLNIFVKYDTFYNMFKKSTHRIDFYNQLVSFLNESLYGRTKLILGNAVQGSQATYTIIDMGLDLAKIESENDFKNLYRFNIGVSGSIIRGFEFSYELSDLMQGQAAFSSISMINSIVGSDTTKPPLIATGSTGEYSFTNEGYEKFDMSCYANADRFTSIDRAAVELVLESAEANAKKKAANPQLNPIDDKKDGSATQEPINLEASLSNKSVKFKIGQGNDNVKTLIYTDKSFLIKELYSDLEQNKEKATSALTFLEITAIIDGTSGINSGEIFKITGIPEIYNINGFFQVTNVKHLIENEGWKTVIEAGYRIKHG